MNWKEIRSQFRAFDSGVYVNTAATGLVPVSTVNLMKQMYEEHSKRGAAIAEEWAVEMENIRKKIADLIHADEYEIAIVPNMSIGMNWLAMMLKNTGYTVGCVEGDFPSLISPWEVHDYKVKKINADKNGAFSYASLKKLKTEILAVSHVQWHTGYKIDLSELKKIKSKNQLLILDATQSLGTCEIDVKKQDVDIMMASCYKWMMAGFGACIMYVKKEILQKFDSYYCWQYRAVAAGHENYFPSARRFEIGHERHDSFYRLGNGIDLIQEIGIKKIEKRVEGLKKYFYQKLKENNIKTVFNYDKKNRSQIVIVEGGFNTQLALEKKNIYTSFRGTGLRISLHFYNNKKDIDRLIKALKKIKK